MSGPAGSALTTIERVIARQRAIVALALTIVTGLAWVYLLMGAGTGMSVLSMTTWQFPPTEATLFGPADWNWRYGLMMIVMWFVMMVAMMVPSAAPMIMLYGRVHLQAQAHGQVAASTVPTASFSIGYLTCWLGFSIAATFLQWALEHAGLIDGMWMWSLNRAFTAGLLIAAGLYQLSPLKNVCLAACRSPAGYLAGKFKADAAGAFTLGLRHGAFCLGCCWPLMLLLFAGGVMNLVWIAGLTILVLLEKLMPFGARLTVPIAVALIAGGVAVLAS